MVPVLPSTLIMLLLVALGFSQPVVSHPNGFHLPLYKCGRSRLDRRAGGVSGSVGLGNSQDITYAILMDIGGTETSLVLDTGSSDLWVMSDACKGSSCANGVTLYPQANFRPANVNAQLFYGDSQTGTHAFGEIGTDTVGVAGLSITNQYFAAINDTNTTVGQTGSAGIFGLGFPVNSVIWSQLFKAQFPTDRQPPTKRSNLRMTKFPDIPSLFGGPTSKRIRRDLPYGPDLRRTRFPDLASLLPPRITSKRQAPSSSVPSLADVLNSFGTNGPLLSRFVAQRALSSPQFTVTLQRDTIQIGGNAGILSVGGLPQGVTNDSLTWVPVRGYTAQQGGIDSPTDIYPIAWEIPIDAVFLDGQKLPQSTLSPGVSLTALVDTGNSLIRGPQDVVQSLLTTVTGSSTGNAYDCSVPHTMSFQIGGAMFPVDPRDFFNQPRKGDIKNCQPNVAATDPPHNGFLYSWSLGDPFLKSNLVSFYYGNLTHPSDDPPRMGFMSTVKSDANAQFQSAVSAAQANGGTFPAQTEAAPSSNPSIITTFTGVPQAEITGGAAMSTSDNGSNSHKSGAHATTVVSWRVLSFVSLMASVWAW